MALIVEGGASFIKQDTKHLACRGQTHQCVSCRAPCDRGGYWFRCDECEQSFCGDCFASPGLSAQQHAGHTFTDMYRLLVHHGEARPIETRIREHTFAARRMMCRRTSYICDGCDAALQFGNWFQGNGDADKVDLCAACMLLDSAPCAGQSFTDMSDVLRFLLSRTFPTRTPPLPPHPMMEPPRPAAVAVLRQENERHALCGLCHACDGCGKRVSRGGDWFRCNECRDFDLCGACLVSHTHTAGHTFTDMSVVLAGDASQPRIVNKRETLERKPLCARCLHEVPSDEWYRCASCGFFGANTGLRAPVCDGCHTLIRPSEPRYRCNECPRTVEYCGRCLPAVHREHGGGAHSFTEVPPRRNGAQGAAPLGAQARERVSNDPVRHRFCNPTTHVCDGCARALRPGNWYRCNRCEDFDYCAACLNSHHAEHAATHTFTDMSFKRGRGGGWGPGGCGRCHRHEHGGAEVVRECAECGERLRWHGWVQCDKCDSYRACLRCVTSNRCAPHFSACQAARDGTGTVDQGVVLEFAIPVLPAPLEEKAKSLDDEEEDEPSANKTNGTGDEEEEAGKNQGCWSAVLKCFTW